jgi:hypothetical protein
VWQTVRASSAAPYYLEDFWLAHQRFVDGAVTVNNPAVVAVQEARMLFPDIPIELVVSIGVGSTPPSQRPKGMTSSLETLSAGAHPIGTSACRIMFSFGPAHQYASPTLWAALICLVTEWYVWGARRLGTDSGVVLAVFEAACTTERSHEALAATLDLANCKYVRFDSKSNVIKHALCVHTSRRPDRPSSPLCPVTLDIRSVWVCIKVYIEKHCSLTMGAFKVCSAFSQQRCCRLNPVDTRCNIGLDCTDPELIAGLVAATNEYLAGRNDDVADVCGILQNAFGATGMVCALSTLLRPQHPGACLEWAGDRALAQSVGPPKAQDVLMTSGTCRRPVVMLRVACG